MELLKLCRSRWGFDEASLLRLRELSLDKEVDVNQKDESGYSPFHLIFWSKGCQSLLQSLQALLERNSVDVNECWIACGGWSALSYLCYFYVGYNFIEIVRLLIQHGADANLTATENWNRGFNSLLSLCSIPFCKEIEPKLLEIVKILIDSGADVNAKDSAGENSLLKLTNLRFNHPDYYAMASLLIDRGCDVNQKNSYGCTPLLHIAIYYAGPYLIEIVRMLVCANADVHVKDHNGFDAAYYLKWRNILPPNEIDRFLSVNL